MRTSSLLKRGESSLHINFTRHTSYTQCFKATTLVHYRSQSTQQHVISRRQFGSSRSFRDDTKPSESVIAPRPSPLEFNPTPFSEKDMINGSVAMPTSQPISRRAMIYKAAARLARRDPNITFDDILVERIVKGEAVLFLNDDEKARVEALAIEMERDKAAKKSLVTGNVETPEDVKVSNFPEKSMQALLNWSSRGLNPAKVLDEDISSAKKGKRGRPKKKGPEEDGSASVENSDAKISKTIHKNGSFDPLERDRFQEKIKELM